MLIGIDVGGSKNDLILCKSDGQVLARVIDAGSNIAELGVDAACDRMLEQLERLLAEHGGLNAEIRALAAGMAGGGNQISRQLVSDRLRSAMPRLEKVLCTSDIATALYAGVGAGDGMVVIAGTGASAMTRCADRYAQVGGWGHLIDDAGSGFWMGKEVINAALRQLDGRGPETLLTELVNARLGASVRSCIPQLYSGGKRTIAAFAPLTFEAAAKDDSVALDIIQRAADELVLIIRACAKHLAAPPWRVALTGGLWGAPLLLDAVRARLNEDYELCPVCIPQVCGAALAAAELADGQPCEGFLPRLTQTISTVPILSPKK